MGIIRITYWYLWQLQKWDRETGREGGTGGCHAVGIKEPVSGKKSLCFCVIGATVILALCKRQIGPQYSPGILLLFLMLLSVVVGCLLTASVMDVRSHMVYDYVWYVGILAGIILLCVGKRDTFRELILFSLLQEVFFCKMYGRADCHAFVVCAVTETALGIGLKGYLLQMLLAFGLLALVQGKDRNIGKSGKLKQPVPFLPYIMISFGLFILCIEKGNIVDFFWEK